MPEMKDQSALQLYNRFQKAKANWETWRPMYEEAMAFAFPNFNPWPLDAFEGRKKNAHCYDITAGNSLKRLISRLHATLTPPGQLWFELEAGEYIQDPQERKNLNSFLQLFTNIIFKTLNDSNFDLVISELYQLLTIGIGGMMAFETGDKDDPVIFKSCSIDRIYPEGNAFDQIKTVWREFKKIYGQDILQLWPDAKIPDRIKMKMDQDPLSVFQFAEGVIHDPDSKKFRVVVFDCDQQTKEFLVDRWTESSPWIVARWGKQVDEVGGRGPVIDALPTIRSLNVLVETILRNVALSTSPPWLAASDGVFNAHNFQIAPNKVIPVSRQQSFAEGPLKRLDVASDITMGNLEVNYLATMIKDCLFDMPVRPIDSPSQTATEIMIRQQQFLEEIGPAFGRLAVELLPPIIERMVYVLQRVGKIPNSIKIDKKNINVRFKSPLLKSADMQKITNLQNYAGVMQNIVGPELSIASINVAELPNWIGEKLDVDELLIKKPAEIRALIAQTQQAANPEAQEQERPTALTYMANAIQQNQSRGSLQ